MRLTVAGGHHVACGIALLGPNARAADPASLGVVQVSAVPETVSELVKYSGASERASETVSI